MSNRRSWLVMAFLVFGACGGDDGAEQGAPDATFEPGIDATSATLCLPTDDLECDVATTVCLVETPVGPASRSRCEPVPPGCESDRSCDCLGDTLCKAPFDTCEDSEDNIVTCVCLTCQ